jgi:hypothetical protein
MAVSDSVKKTVAFLSAVYEKQSVNNFLVNINAIFTGMLFVFMMMSGYNFLITLCVGSLFIINTSWFVSNLMSSKDRSE